MNCPGCDKPIDMADVRRNGLNTSTQICADSLACGLGQPRTGGWVDGMSWTQKAEEGVDA